MTKRASNPDSRNLTRRISDAARRTLSPRLLLTVAALGGGALLYPLAALVNRLTASVLPLSPFLAVIPEEALKLIFTLAFVLAARALRTPSLALLGALGTTALGCVENLAYMAAFPDAFTYLRVGWSLPLHANAGALYALALSTRRPPLAGTGAFLFSCAVHGVFNTLALGTPSKATILGGIVFNAAMSLGLAVAAQEHFAFQGVFNGTERV